ncbi:hypothetical protein quinque_008888 [Culex quinquefasciatus]
MTYARRNPGLIEFMIDKNMERAARVASRLSNFHLSSILKQYNVSLSGRYVTVLPSIKLSHAALAAALDPLDLNDADTGNVPYINTGNAPFYPETPIEILLCCMLIAEGTTGNFKGIYETEHTRNNEVTNIKLTGDKVVAARLSGRIDFLRLETYTQGRQFDWGFTSAYRRTHIRTGSAGSLSMFQQPNGPANVHHGHQLQFTLHGQGGFDDEANHLLLQQELPAVRSGRIVPRFIGLTYTDEVELVTGTRLLSSSCFRPLSPHLKFSAESRDPAR